MQIRKAQIPCTTDYSIFEMNQLNRNLHENPVLVKSMQEHGFLVSKAITVRKLPSGKLGVIAGHHRLHYAKRLGLPVYYIVEDVELDLFELEGQKQDWTVDDFAHARANSGDKDCMALVKYAKDKGIPLGIAASLLAGESAGSKNAYHLIKFGKFHLGDQKHGEEVISLAERLRDLGVEFSHGRLFLYAISACLRVPEFDANNLVKKVELYPRIIKRRASLKDFLEEIENAYNHGVKIGPNRIPLAFRVREVGLIRRASFGRNG
jgi:hypothetical protein